MWCSTASPQPSPKHHRSPTRCARRESISRRCATTSGSRQPAPAACASCASQACRDWCPRARRRLLRVCTSIPSSPDLEAARRRAILALLASRYPAEPVRADPDKPFHQEIAAHGLADHSWSRRNRRRSIGLIRTSRSTCRAASSAHDACASATKCRDSSCGTCAIAASSTRIEPDGPNLLTSSCVSCGACVDTCPTGALEDATFETLGAATAWTQTVCPYCGTGCELSVGTRDGRIVSVKPVRHSAVSKGHLCVKGRYAFEFVSAGDRVTEPMIRESDGWRRVGWDEALAFTAAGLRRVIERDGPDAVGVLGVGATDQRGELSHPEVHAQRHRHEQRRLLRTRLPHTERYGIEADARLGALDQLVRRHRTRRRHSGLRRKPDGESSGRRGANQTGGEAPRRRS